MTDKQMAELLYMFHEIEELMVQNGANEINKNGIYTSFKEKINSFDTFEFEPKNPGNVGYKFYVKEDKFCIKEAYKYDVNIKEQLNIYEKYKSHERRYLEYRTTILGGNYYVLKKIGHIRNKLLYIENYEIEGHKLFVKDCRSMIKYLKNPDKKRFLTYGKFTNSARDKLLKLKALQLKAQSVETGISSQGFKSFLLKAFIFLSMLTAIILSLRYFNLQNVSSLSDSNMGRYIWGSIFAAIALYFLFHILKFLNHAWGWILKGLIFIASLIGLKYLSDNQLFPFGYFNYDFSMGEYILGSMLLATGLYYLSSIFTFLTSGWGLKGLMFLASVFGIKYLNDNGFLPAKYANYDFSISEYLLGGAFLALLIYLLPSILTSINNFIAAFLTGLFSLFFSKGSMGNILASIVPFILGLWFIYYLLIYGKDIRGQALPAKPHTVHTTTKPKRVVHKKCQYYYVHVDILHVRAKANDNSQIIDKVYKNEKLCITQKKLHWYYVRRKGWVFTQHISTYDNRLGQTLY